MAEAERRRASEEVVSTQSVGTSGYGHDLNRYLDDEAWPVQASVAVLGALLIGLIAQHQPSDLSQWPVIAWVTVGLGALITIGVMIGAAFIDPRIVRRPLQLALVLCLIVHAILVVQMVHARFDT